MNYLARFLYVISAGKYQLVLIVFLFLTISLLDAVGVGLIGPFISLAVNPALVQRNTVLSILYRSSGLESNSRFIAVLGLIIIVVYYIKSFFYHQIQHYVYKFCYAQQVKLRLRLLRTYLTLPYTFHLRTNSAHLLQTIGAETDKFIYSIAIPLLNSLANLFVLFVLLILLAKTDFIATVSILGLLLISIIPFHYFRHKVTRWGKEGLEANTETLRVVNHAIGGLKETKIIGCEGFFEDQLRNQTDKYAKAASQFHTFQLLPRIVIEALLISFVVGFVSLSLVYAERAESLVSVLGVFAIASIRIVPSASQLIHSMGLLRNNKPTLDRIYLDLKELEKPEDLFYIEKNGRVSDLFDKGRNTVDSQIRVGTLTFEDEIVINKINYCYPGAALNALTDVSLRIQKGESIALIGSSGAGKTTLVDVLLGLLVPQSGDLQVDHFSAYSNLRAWQNLIGYIPQSIFLTDDTIARNIAFGVPNHQIDRQKLDKAIRLAQLSELMQQLPEGIQTVVGERGVLLSGGQRQRIGIARALYHEREILVLDEATSALDNETEGLISEALRELGGQKTIVIIAHRLTTVEHCDCIYSIKDGRIIASGTYQEVVLGNRGTRSF